MRLKKIFSTFPFFIFLASLLIYSSVLIPPEKFWPAGVITYAILPMLVANFMLLAWLAFRTKRSAIWPALALIVGWYFITITFHFSIGKPSQQNLEILSYNSHRFKPRYDEWGYSTKMMDWFANDSSTIKCVQEFSSNERKPEYSVFKKMQAAGYSWFSTEAPGAKIPKGNKSRLAIFSKFPIINTGIFPINIATGNHGIYADIKWHNDTIRIYDVRLFSMSIPLHKYQDTDQYESKMKHLIRKLKNGSINRSIEIDHLINHVEKCPYPYVICGDFNGIPYGYNYRKLSAHFNDAFDEAGRGFGFTFNSKTVFFLRIDHQFYGNGLAPERLQVGRGMAISDHFPIRGNYHLEK